MEKVLLETAITRTTGNTQVQDTSGTAASSVEVGVVNSKVNLIFTQINNNNLLNIGTKVPPSLADISDLKAAQIQIKRNNNDTVIKTVKYIDNTYSAMFEVRSTYAYNRILCARDVREYVYGMKADAAYSRNWNKRYAAPLVSYDTKY